MKRFGFIVLLIVACVQIGWGQSRESSSIAALQSMTRIEIGIESVLEDEPSPYDLTEEIEILQTVLANEALAKKEPILIAKVKIMLNTLLAMADDPRVDYEEMRQGFETMEHYHASSINVAVIGAFYYCLGAAKDERIDDVIAVGDIGVRWYENRFDEREQFFYSALLEFLSSAYFMKREWEAEADTLAKLLAIMNKQENVDLNDYEEHLEMYALSLTMSRRYLEADSCFAVQRKLLEAQGRTNEDAYFDVLMNIADNYTEIGRMSDAETVYGELKKICPRKSAYYLATLEKLNLLYTDMHDDERALAVLKEAIGILQKMKVDVQQMSTWVTACKNPLVTDEMSKIKDIIEQNTDNRNPLHLCVKATVYTYLQDYDKVADILKDIKHTEKNCKPEDRGTLYAMMSRMYAELEDFDSIVDLWLHYMNYIEQEFGTKHPLYQELRIMLAENYCLAGQYHECIALLDSCEHACEGNEENLLDIYQNMADAYAWMGNYNKSNEYFRKGMKITHSPSDKITLLDRLCANLISELELRTTNADEDGSANQMLVDELLSRSKELYGMARETYGANSQTTITKRTYVAVAHYFNNDLNAMQSELKSYEDELNSYVKNTKFRSAYLENLAILHIKAENPSHALALLDESSLSRPNALFIEKSATLQAFADAHLAMNDPERARTYYLQLAELIEQETKDLMNRMSHDERQLYWRTQRQTLLNAGKYVNVTGEQAPFNGTYFNMALLAKNRLLEMDDRQNPNSSKAISWGDIKDRLESDELVAEFVLYNDLKDISHYGVLLLKKEWKYPVFQIVGDKQTIDAKFLSDNSSFEQYSNFWECIEPFADGVNTVFFSPVSRIHTVPVENGIMSGVKAYRLSSTSEIAKSSHRQMGKAVIYGGLTYDEQATSSASTSSASGERFAIEGLAYLPSTKEEAESIAAILKSEKIGLSLFVGKEGTENRLKQATNTDVSIMHIATHGFYEPSNGYGRQDRSVFNLFVKETEDQALTRAGIYMAGAQLALDGELIREYADDGILTAQEISALDLRSLDLVTLSACDTGKGDITGDGVFGLQRGFKKAGANSILMSLWKVDDAATCRLMTEFYSNWISKKMTKHDALEAAKRTIRETKGWEAPKYWAAFILLDGLE